MFMVIKIINFDSTSKRSHKKEVQPIADHVGVFEEMHMLMSAFTEG